MNINVIIQMETPQRLQFGRSKRVKTNLTVINIPWPILERVIRIIGYDNAERKGDHRHYENREYPYIFKDVDQLFKDTL